MIDKYDEKADEIMIANGYASSSMHKEIAAFGRECAAQAYEDAVKGMRSCRASEDCGCYAGNKRDLTVKSDVLRKIIGATRKP